MCRLIRRVSCRVTCLVIWRLNYRVLRDVSRSVALSDVAVAASDGASDEVLPAAMREATDRGLAWAMRKTLK